MDGHLTDRPGLGLLVLVADCLPVALAAPGPRGDAALRLARAGRRDRGARARVASTSHPRRPWARASALLLRGRPGGARGLRRPGWRGRRPTCSTCARWPSAKLAAGGVGQVEHVDLCTIVPPRPVLLAPPRRRASRAARPGWSAAHVTRRFSNLDAGAVRRQPRARARADRRRRPRPGRRWRSAPPSSTWTPRSCRRSPRRAYGWSARTAPRTCWPRAPSIPACCEWDFIGALQSRKVRDLASTARLIHTVASDSAPVAAGAAPGARGARSGERGWGGGQGGDRPRRTCPRSSNAARCRWPA